jgi:hypothetical protein
MYQVQVRLTLRLTVSLSWCRAPPLTRGRVSHLSKSPELLQFSSVILLLALASYLHSTPLPLQVQIFRRVLRKVVLCYIGFAVLEM